uniref:16 kDa subunit of oxygen evolving system of photosystem II n=1 Tax=Opuntia streptacantha TaxID=393608 RepID=A0A7C8YND1_OPUST
MAQAMASIAGLRGPSPAVLEGSLQLTGSSLSGPNSTRLALPVSIRAQQHVSADTIETSRRAMLGLVAAGLASGPLAWAAIAEEGTKFKPKPIPIGPPPPPSGGLPGTLNSDLPRDFQLPYKERFYLQPLPPQEAAQRAKESAQDIYHIKEYIDKKEWPYVQNDLRLKTEYLRYDLNTVINSKPKEEKKYLKELTDKLYQNMANLDHAAKIKSTPEAEKYYAETVSSLNDVLAKLG